MSQVNLLPTGTKKFRENNADSTLFHINGHSPEFPFTLVASRELPKPRKGNLGTQKTFLNVRRMINIGTAELPRHVPFIVKIEVSAPVGSNSQHLNEVMTVAQGLIPGVSSQSFLEGKEVFLTGELIEVKAPAAEEV